MNMNPLGLYSLRDYAKLEDSFHKELQNSHRCEN